jgi:hypothetical protein
MGHELKVQYCIYVIETSLLFLVLWIRYLSNIILGITDFPLTLEIKT